MANGRPESFRKELGSESARQCIEGESVKGLGEEGFELRYSS